jgi:hypothetical protein
MNGTLREDTQKDPETLEREIDQTRAAMNQTLDTLERKLTPGQLLDQCLSFLGQSGTDLGKSLGNAVKENPMPVLLTATGIAWMMFSPRGDSSRRAYAYTGDADYGEGLYDTEEGKLSKMTESIKSGATSARSQFTSSKEAVSDTVTKTADTVKETAYKTANMAQAQGRRAREGFNSLLEEQPLILGALGIAVGAAIGAALPSTEQEDRWMGEAREKTMNKVKAQGAQTFERARETVKEKAGDMRQAASEHDKAGAVETHT